MSNPFEFVEASRPPKMIMMLSGFGKIESLRNGFGVGAVALRPLLPGIRAPKRRSMNEDHFGCSPPH